MSVIVVEGRTLVWRPVVGIVVRRLAALPAVGHDIVLLLKFCRLARRDWCVRLCVLVLKYPLIAYII